MDTQILPSISDIETYRHFFKQDIWLPFIHIICERHKLSKAGLERYATGSTIVYRNAQHAVIKLFAPLWAEEIHQEKAGLSHFAPLVLNTPEILHQGFLEDWPYLVVSELPGESIGDIWPRLSEREKYPIIESMGQIMAEMHQLPFDGEFSTAQWKDFLKERYAAFLPTQTRLGVHPDLLRELEPVLQEGLEALASRAFTPTLMHCDLTHDHFLLEKQQGRYRITGLFDFGDIMPGDPLYEFGAPLVFFTYGSPVLQRALIESYGLEYGLDTSDQIFAMTLFHRFVNLPEIYKTELPKDALDFKARLLT